MHLLDLREKLDEGILVGDGAIGTLLADRGVASPYYLTPPASMPHLAGDVVEAVSNATSDEGKSEDEAY